MLSGKRLSRYELLKSFNTKLLKVVSVCGGGGGGGGVWWGVWGGGAGMLLRKDLDQYLSSSNVKKSRASAQKVTNTPGRCHFLMIIYFADQ